MVHRGDGFIEIAHLQVVAIRHTPRFLREADLVGIFQEVYRPSGVCVKIEQRIVVPLVEQLERLQQPRPVRIAVANHREHERIVGNAMVVPKHLLGLWSRLHRVRLRDRPWDVLGQHATDLFQFFRLLMRD